ncbi:hypothetical protein [Sphingomonas sp. KC8]|uniref:hypothetical protein n=1 Tax=Sphingomonas sp. KC8 TaxID=1030157 RepID=UPI0002F3F71D|nr:hypothetical protein [Sphingomonas sp. KC8]ARS27622.1 hypothetical protein KC8_09990 [Sphingomonas sp. KC8]
MSSAVSFIGRSLLGPIGKMIVGKPKAAQPISQRPVTRDDAAAQMQADDDLRRRRGAGANLLTGPSGAEARTAGGKVLLGQ